MLLLLILFMIEQTGESLLLFAVSVLQKTV